MLNYSITVIKVEQHKYSTSLYIIQIVYKERGDFNPPLKCTYFAQTFNNFTKG